MVKMILNKLSHKSGLTRFKVKNYANLTADSSSHDSSLRIFIYILKKVLSEAMLSDCFNFSIWIEKGGSFWRKKI